MARYNIEEIVAEETRLRGTNPSPNTHCYSHPI